MNTALKNITYTTQPTTHSFNNIKPILKIDSTPVNNTNDDTKNIVIRNNNFIVKPNQFYNKTHKISPSLKQDINKLTTIYNTIKNKDYVLDEHKTTIINILNSIQNIEFDRRSLTYKAFKTELNNFKNLSNETVNDFVLFLNSIFTDLKNNTSKSLNIKLFHN
jgi:hypothetical protein